MTQDQCNTLFKAGDAGALWAAVENHIDQAQNAAQAAVSAAESKMTKLATDVRAAVADLNMPTEETVLAIVADATKDERQKKIDDAQAEIARLQEVIANA